MEESMPWDCMSCKYQKLAKYQEERIRYLELELKVTREEVNLLKNGNTGSYITKIMQVTVRLSQRIPDPGPAGSLLMMYLILG
jgi:hypothetical protein